MTLSLSLRTALTASLLALGASAAQAAKTVDLKTPEGASIAGRKTQCSMKDGEPTVYWFHGEGFSRVPGGPSNTRGRDRGRRSRARRWHASD